MSDLIDRQAAIDAVTFGITYAKAIDIATGEAKELFTKENEELRKAAERIEQLPSTQPEIIRCKECKFAVLTDDGEYCPEDMVCSYWESDGLTETDYCSYAERKEDE